MRRNITFALFIALLGTFSLAQANAAGTAPETFKTPDGAASAVVAAVEKGDRAALFRIFGEASKDLLESGDEVQDRQNRKAFLNMYREKHRLETKGAAAIWIVGADDWPFPVPLVQQNGMWFFDAAAGREEIINRRIGGNELSAIEFSRQYVEAQKKYMEVDRDGDGYREYAQTFFSAPGKKNGLFWFRRRGEQPSPLGPLAAQAFAEGYLRHTEQGQQPYHGYYFRILTAQGSQMPGGKKSYIDEGGRMTGGFALVAYPARWGVSGIMTFMVNQDGRVFQKNLGPRSSDMGKTLKEYDPDSSWREVENENG